MTPETETLLLEELRPRLRAAIVSAVPLVGCDNLDELVQDGLAIALGFYRSARQKRKSVRTGNLAYYTVCHLRSGRRSTGERRSDHLAPACQLSDRSRLCSLDAPVSQEETGEEPLTLHDCLAAPADDPATAAARHLDWQSVVASVDRIGKAILLALIEARELTRLVAGLRRSSSTPA